MRDAIALIIQVPRHDFRAGHRFSRICFEHETFEVTVARTQHEREVAHPDVCERDLIVLLAEIRSVARHEEIETGFELVRRGQCFGAFLVIRRRRQLRGPFECGLPGEQLFAFGFAEGFGTAVILLEKNVPIVRDGAKVNVRDIAVAHFQSRAGIPPVFRVNLDLGRRDACPALTIPDTLGRNGHGPS